MVLEQSNPKKLIIYSRDEAKQFDMHPHFAQYKNIRFFIGDVRDKERFKLALHDVDYVVHAAALKQVPAMEYNPTEAIKTNIIGAMNVIEASLEMGVKKVVALSTDKACNPINLYGATKLCSDKLFIAANSYSSKGRTKFSVVRYGNVAGSRGSIIPVFKKHKTTGELLITDPRMTRFWITLEEGVDLVVYALQTMLGGELYVPKIPSFRVTDLAKAMAPECKIKVIGVRPGEKMHEVLISQDEARQTIEDKNVYIIKPAHPWWGEEPRKGFKPVAEDFCFSSDTNKNWLSVKEMEKFTKDL